MKPREKIRQAHEDAVIDQFLEWYNSKNGTNFKVFEKPQPPDALAQDDGKFIWLEHADIYRNSEEAREERSAVTPGEIPYERRDLIYEPDKRTAFAFIATLTNKLSKNSYNIWFEKYGPGILILTERDPLFNESTLDCITEELKTANLQSDQGYFHTVYLVSVAKPLF